MSEPDNFLSRWSRRKAAGTEKYVETSVSPDANVDVGAEPKESGSAAPVRQKLTPPSEFDPATLPSIESIVAGTDVSVFLKAGVPADLTRAALRRAWAADPNIRDFIGLSENSWDFTAPGGVPGFGPLSAEEAGRLMAQYTSTAKEVAGKTKEAIERISQIDQPKAPTQAEISPSEFNKRTDDHADATKQTTSPTQDQLEQKSRAIDDASNSLQRGKENIATQHSISESNDSRPTRRAHGRALPD
jgi:hypothetical protein